MTGSHAVSVSPCCTHPDSARPTRVAAWLDHAELVVAGACQRRAVVVGIEWATVAGVPAPEGFVYVQRGNEVVITHHGKTATTLRGQRAAVFLDEIEAGDPQELMARLTGNYRRGNERQARNHARNRNAGG